MTTNQLKALPEQDTPLQRLRNLLDDRLTELLSESGDGGLTSTQVVEQRQMLQQLQHDIPNGLSPVFAPSRRASSAASAERPRLGHTV